MQFSFQNKKVVIGIIVAVAILFAAVTSFFMFGSKNKSTKEIAKNEEKISPYNEKTLEQRLGNPSEVDKKGINPIEGMSKDDEEENMTNNGTNRSKNTNEEESTNSSNDLENNTNAQNTEEDKDSSSNSSDSTRESSQKSGPQPTSSARIVLPKSDEEQAVIDTITSILASEFGKAENVINVVVDFNNSGYAKGVYGFENEPGGGLFLAQESEGWDVVWYGKGQDFCSKTSSYDLPQEMTIECN